MSIVTAAPQTNFLGIKDSSFRREEITRVPVPSHLPLILSFASKGGSEMEMVSGASAIARFGDDFFDVRAPHATHQTVLAERLNSVGNALMVKRLIPSDAAPAANVRVSVDVVKTKIDPYLRNDDGTIQLDAAGAPKPAPNKIDGYLLKFVQEPIAAAADGSSNVGKGVMKTGTLVGAANEESKRYPLFDAVVSDQGSYGNLLGWRIWAGQTDTAYPVNESLIRKQKAFPYYFALVQKPDASSTAKPVYTDYGEGYVQLTLKPDSYNSDTDMDYFAGTELLSQWAQPNAADHLKPKGPFGTFHLYQKNIEDIVKLIAAAEKGQMVTYPAMVHDLVEADKDDHYRVNLFGARTSAGVPYIATQIVTTSKVTAETVARFTENSNIMAAGGSDGTMDAAMLSKMAGEFMASFADTNNKYLDIIRYPMSVFYDTGFTMETKKSLAKFLAIRKDVALVLSTHVFGERELTPSEESSVAIALRTFMQTYPESTFWGTPVCRGLVVGHIGRLLNSRFKSRITLAVELGKKFGRFMGASDGIWKSDYAPDRSPTNRVEDFSEVSDSYKPALVRNRDWNAGLVWVDPYDINGLYWPALRTVYEDDTSILTSAITIFAACELEKIGARVHTEFSGVQITNGQLKERVEARFNDLTKGRFDDRFEITPEVLFTKADIKRGYSWLLKVTLAGPNMKTVQTLYIEAQRLDRDEVATTSINI